MRPVVKGADPPYTGKTSFTFAGANATAIKAVIPRPNATNIPIADCLNVWLLQAKGLAPTAGTAAEQTKAVSAIKNQVGELYKLASTPLTTRLGPFCSFCETPLPGLLEVEHCVPKSPYPTFSVSWANFLLACGPCNTAKGNTPSRATVAGWIGAPNPTEQQNYDQIRVQRYVWPDLNPLAYRWMPIELQMFVNNAWTKVPDDAAYNPNSELVSSDIATRTVIARLVDQNNTFIDARIRAVVTGAPASMGQADTMIDLCGLNVVNSLTSTYDRRMMNRTLAWLTCLKFIKMVAQAPVQSKPTFFQILEMMAVATGFYSVWVQCLAFVDVAAARQFVADTNNARGFPGTNATSVP